MKSILVYIARLYSEKLSTYRIGRSINRFDKLTLLLLLMILFTIKFRMEYETKDRKRKRACRRKKKNEKMVGSANGKQKSMLRDIL